jgi:hypothetical protein
MNSRLLVFCLIQIACTPFLSAQSFSHVSARYSDDLTDWLIYQEHAIEVDTTLGVDAADIDTEYDYELIGNLSLLWPLRKDLRDWQYEIEGERGSIRQKWSTDKTHWELSNRTSRITMQPTYPGDARNWRITDNDIVLNLQCRYGNTADEWLVDDSRYGTFYVYTEIEGDPRDWVIKNKLSKEVPEGMHMAIVFIVLHFSK